MKKADKLRGQKQMQEIALWIGLRCAEVSKVFLPRIQDTIELTDKTISFGLRFKAKMGPDGAILCELVPTAPKIPTEDLETMPFILKKDVDGQLEFLFGGTMEAMIAEATAEPEPVAPGDDYQPGDNAEPAPTDRHNDPHPPSARQSGLRPPQLTH